MPPVVENEDDAAEDQYRCNKQRTVSEKDLRHNEDDLVGVGVKNPVVLSWEKEGMEHDKGPVKVHRG